MPTTTGRWQIGLALSLTAAVCWGVLPIALKIVLQGLDAYTITWYRFAVSALVLAAILAVTGGLPPVVSLNKRIWGLLAIALIGVLSNYVLYLVALSHTSPTIAQTVSQLGPMFLLLGGLIVFKEHFSARQWIGFAVLLLGLGLFFNRRLMELSDLSRGLGFGVALLVIAAVLWSSYGLAQKRLLGWLTPPQILLFLYVGSVLVLLPFTAPGTIRSLNGLQLGMLAFCALNTLVGYGAFGESLKHWEVSRIGAVLATAPLFTVASMWILERFMPALVVPEHLNGLSLIGTLLVVCGSATCALAAARPSIDP